MSTSLNGAPAQPCAPRIPAAIAGSVNLLILAGALAKAGLVGRRDTTRDVLVIEPAPPRCISCGGTGLDEDAICDFCDGTGHEGAARSNEPSSMFYAPAGII